MRIERLEDRRMLATIVVDSAADNSLVDGLVTLREAIEAANTNASVDGSAAGSGADTIRFADALAGQTIALNGTELEVTETVRIDASVLLEPVQIDAGMMSRVFNFSSSTGDFALIGVRLTNGETTATGKPGAGGALLFQSDGSVTLESTTITGSKTTGSGARGGALYTEFGSAVLIASSVIDNRTTGASSYGGGIATGFSDVTLTRSSINDNRSTGRGGGIYTRFGTVQLDRSSINNNVASTGGGGIYNEESAVTLLDSTVSGNATTSLFGGGGGINANGNIEIRNSTISSNSTGRETNGGGVYARGGDLLVENSTITRNSISSQDDDGDGGGIYIFDPTANQTLAIINSIVALNSAGAGQGPDVFRDVADNLTLSHSLIGINADTGFAAAPLGSPDANGNLIGTETVPIDPLLGPLNDNGGSTLSHLPLPESPVIDSGDSVLSAVQVHDQRGAPFLRAFDAPEVMGSATDMGSIEVQVVTHIRVDSDLDEADGDYSMGNLSIREAIDLANGLTGTITILFSPTLSGSTIHLEDGDLDISESLVIDGSSLSETITLDAQAESRIFDLNAANENLTIIGLHITNGLETADNTPGSGGAIRFRSLGELVIDTSSITDSKATGFDADGGGIFVIDGNLTIRDSTISGNSTEGISSDGGGIFMRSGDINIIRSTISGNTTHGANSEGGGLYSRDGGAVTLNQATVTNNRTTGTGSEGGGLITFANTGSPVLVIQNSIVADNLVANGGGPDLVPDDQAILEIDYSLIGDTHGSGIVSSTGEGNVLDQSPMLAPLADNGGRTLTHALLVGSLAIDAGNPSIAFDPSEFDQRGAPFCRVVDIPFAINASIDIGAFELQSEPQPVLPGDYNQDGEVNAADYTLWRDTLGDSVIPFELADGDGDGIVGSGDYQVWRSNFGSSLPSPVTKSQVPLNTLDLTVSKVLADYVVPLYSSQVDWSTSKSFQSLNRSSVYAQDFEHLRVHDSALLLLDLDDLSRSRIVDEPDRFSNSWNFDPQSNDEELANLDAALSDLLG